jgi:GNAT superfamily N-acetyltransferase
MRLKKQHGASVPCAFFMRKLRKDATMTLTVLGWAQFAQGLMCRQASLIRWKLLQFKKVGWGGSDVAKWGGTASISVPLNDEQVPFGCVSVVNGDIAGVAFVIDNDLKNYPVDGEIDGEFIEPEVATGEIANPWFAGELVEEQLRGQGIGKQQEQFVIEQARKLADAGKWSYPRRRLWLFTEREPLHFLPEMYERWGWKLHRTFFYDGLQRWVMYYDF